MDDETFFPARPETRPMIYAYEEDNPKYAGMLKVGFASTGVEKILYIQFRANLAERLKSVLSFALVDILFGLGDHCVEVLLRPCHKNRF